MAFEKPQGNTNAILRFSGMAFQMGVTIFAGVWAGQWLDTKFQFQKPWCTLTLALAAVILAMYNVIRDLARLKKP
jgi:membrane protein DedA with SNARE-associated domain